MTSNPSDRRSRGADEQASRFVRDFTGREGLERLSRRSTIFESPTPEIFRATVRTVPLVTARVINLAATAHTAVWNSTRGSVAEQDVMHFTFTTSGSTAVVVDGVDDVDLPGSVRVLRPGTPITYRWLTPARSVSVEVPVTAMPSGSEAIIRRAGADLIGPTALTRAAIAFISSVFTLSPRPGSDDAHHLERTIVSLIYAVVAESLSVPTDREDVDDVVFARAVQLILGELGNPALSVDSIASRLGTSPRRLQRVFQTRGTTVSGEIRDRRLEGMAERIRADRLPGGFSQLATEFGFAGLDYVGRAFRARFGMTMSAYRSREADIAPQRRVTRIDG